LIHIFVLTVNYFFVELSGLHFSSRFGLISANHVSPHPVSSFSSTVRLIHISLVRFVLKSLAFGYREYRQLSLSLGQPLPTLTTDVLFFFNLLFIAKVLSGYSLVIAFALVMS
jgi:hypothetical protein